LAKFPPIPDRLSQIDQLSAGDHHYVALDDEGYYCWERVSGARYDEYPTNDFIKNLQIPTALRGQRRWYWKEQAIAFAARALSKLIPEEWKQTSTFVPVPPSLIRNDPGHDERLLTVLNSIYPPLLDVRELVLLNENTVSKEKQISPAERADNYRINEDCAAPDPTHIVIVDDVLTTGSHFKGVMRILQQRYTGVRMVGLFLARAIRPNAIIIPEDDITL
jgi:hypothetical protein